MNDMVNIVASGSTGKVTEADIVVGKIVVHVIDAVLVPVLSS